MGMKHGGFATYPLEFVVLGLLMSGPKHGYALYQEFAQAFDLIWHAEQAKFYGVLAALEDKGFLRVTTELQEKRPARKVYHITDAGQSTFLDWLRQPVTSMRAVRVEFIAKLRLFNLLGFDGVEELFNRQIAALQAMLAEWEQSSNGQKQTRADLVRVWVNDFRRRQAMFMIEWLVACKEDAKGILAID